MQPSLAALRGKESKTALVQVSSYLPNSQSRSKTSTVMEITQKTLVSSQSLRKAVVMTSVMGHRLHLPARRYDSLDARSYRFIEVDVSVHCSTCCRIQSS